MVVEEDVYTYVRATHCVWRRRVCVFVCVLLRERERERAPVDDLVELRVSVWSLV